MGKFELDRKESRLVAFRVRELNRLKEEEIHESLRDILGDTEPVFAKTSPWAEEDFEEDMLRFMRNFPNGYKVKY